MKTSLIAALLAVSPTALAADPILGTWKTQPDYGGYAHVEVRECNDGKICGWIMRTFSEKGEELQTEFLGKALVRNMVNAGGGRYEGRLWRPGNDKTYFGKAELNGDQVRLSGCLIAAFGGIGCESQIWTRVQ